ncbi:MAG: ATP-dependent helicase C-terminal domain-containing protein, partial [Vibrio sp.]
RRSQSLARRLGFAFNPQKLDLEFAGLLVASAYPDRIAHAQGGEHQYLLSQGHGSYLNPTSALAQYPWLVAVDLVRHQGAQHQHTNSVNANQGRSQIFRGIEFDLKQAQDLAQNKQSACQSWFSVTEDVTWDDKLGQVRAWDLEKLGAIILRQEAKTQLKPEWVTQGLLDYVRRHGLQVLNWDKAAKNLQQRVLCARQWLPEETWPDFSQNELLAQLEHWLTPYMINIKQVKQLQKLDLYAALNAYLGWPLNQQIDEWLPKSWALPTGRQQTIDYQFGQDPVLSVKMQEMFGEQQTPMIAKGRQALLVELLSPAQRPLQRTKDLANFWRGSYRDVQKEMKGRYPKHIWPDDPANHQATQKTKRHFNSK